MRALIRERVAVDDLWRILNTLVLVDETGQTGSDEDRLGAALASVRRELGDRITIDSCGLEEVGSTAPASVYETERSFEQRIESWSRADVPELELRSARRSAWRAGVPTAPHPVILTSSSARPLIRLALNQELSDVSVLARSEVPPRVRLARAGSVSGDGSDSSED
jgi:flagellar biosynthesis component FlhA